MVADGLQRAHGQQRRVDCAGKGCGGQQGIRRSHSPSTGCLPQHSMERTAAALSCHTHIPVKLLEQESGKHTSSSMS